MSAPRELLTTAEVAEVLGVTPRRVVALLDRRADFPRPYAVTRGVKRATGLRLWRPEDVDAWAATADRSAGRPRTRDLERPLDAAQLAAEEMRARQPRRRRHSL